MFIIYWFIGHCISSFLYIFVLIWTKFCKLYPFFKIYDQKENAIPEKRKCEANSHYTMLQKQVSIKALISFSLDLLNKQEEEESNEGAFVEYFLTWMFISNIVVLYLKILCSEAATIGVLWKKQFFFTGKHLFWSLDR